MTHETPEAQGPDFYVEPHGSITLLRPLTPPAHAWVEGMLPDDRETWAGAVVVEPRHVEDIVRGIHEAGLITEFEPEQMLRDLDEQAEYEGYVHDHITELDRRLEYQDYVIERYRALHEHYREARDLLAKLARMWRSYDPTVLDQILAEAVARYQADDLEVE